MKLNVGSAPLSANNWAQICSIGLKLNNVLAVKITMMFYLTITVCEGVKLINYGSDSYLIGRMEIIVS